MESKPKELGLPILALSLDLAAILLIYVGSLMFNIPGVLILFSILLPIAGVIIGVVALNKGKARIGKAGKIIAVIAIALPILFVLFALVFFFAAVTGIISLM